MAVLRNKKGFTRKRDWVQYEKKELERMGIKKLPSDEKISSEIESLQKQRSTENANLQKHIKQKEQLSIIQQNFAIILYSDNISATRNKPVPDNLKYIL